MNLIDEQKGLTRGEQRFCIAVPKQALRDDPLRDVLGLADFRCRHHDTRNVQRTRHPTRKLRLAHARWTDEREVVLESLLP